jgi:hypothetical protein
MKPKQATPRLLKPGILTLAAMCLWAATHEPARLDTPSLLAWLFGALTIALLSRAALALAAPFFQLLAAACAPLLAPQRGGTEP